MNPNQLENTQRTTIGFLSENASFDTEAAMFEGAKIAAEKNDINLIYLSQLVGCSEDWQYTPTEEELSRLVNQKHNSLKSLIEHIHVDGLIIIGWTREFQDYYYNLFLNRFPDLPIMSLGKDLPDTHAVFSDGATYVSTLARHLITEHNRKRIAYVCPTNYDSRIDNYVEILKEYDLYDEQLIIHNKDIDITLDSHNRTLKALNILLDFRGLSIDAVIVSNAVEGEVMMEALVQRNIRVPEDISLVCLQDSLSIEFHKPSVTASYYPFKELGYTGFVNLLRLIRGKDVPLTENVPGRIIYRDSCGCTLNKLNRTVNFYINVGIGTIGIEQFDRVQTVDMLRRSYSELPLDYESLVDSYLVSHQTNDENVFLKSFDRALLRMDTSELDGKLQAMLASFREVMLTLKRAELDSSYNSEMIWVHANKLASFRYYADSQSRNIELNNKYHIINLIGQYLSSAYTMPKILQVIEQNLSRIGIDTNYICLFKNVDASYESVELLFQYENNKKSINFNESKTSLGVIFKEYCDRNNKRFTIILNLLFGSDHPIGINWMDLGGNQSHHAIAMGQQISKAFSRALLIEEQKTLVKRLSNEIILRQEKEAQLAHLADTDALTQLYNRRVFYESLSRTMSTHSGFALFYLDIDGFKQINDTKGHEVGDILLVSVANRLIDTIETSTFRMNLSSTASGRSIFRIGGDEFVALINLTDYQAISACANQLVVNISIPYYIREHQLNISTSIGIGLYPSDSTDPNELLNCADMALYYAKKTKNTYAYYSDSHDK